MVEIIVDTCVGYGQQRVICFLLEPAEWPQERDKYRCFNGLGEIHTLEWRGDSADLRYKEFGNCFID